MDRLWDPATIENDEILQELYAQRDAHFAKFNYDIKAYCLDLMERQKAWNLKPLAPTRPA